MMFPHVSCWSTLRTALAFTIAGSLLLVSTVASNLASSAGVGAQGQGAERRVGKPRRDKPAGELPDLEEVQRESQLEREAPAAIPSTMRSPKVPLEPWNGRRVGDPELQRRADQAAQRTQRMGAQARQTAPTRRAHARARVNPPSVLDDQFVQNFFTWTVSRAPSASELSYWNDQLRVAYAQGQASVKLAAVEFAKTLFESATLSTKPTTRTVAPANASRLVTVKMKTVCWRITPRQTINYGPVSLAVL